MVNRVNFDWRFESCADPFFKLDENGLEVSLLIFCGENEKEKEIKSLLKENKFEFDQKVAELDEIYDSIYMQISKLGLENKIKQLDLIFNNGGMGMAYFRFKIFDDIFYGSKETIKIKYKNFAPVLNNERGLYEEINSLGERRHYIFIGHDFSLVIKTSKEFCDFYIDKLEIAGL